MFVACSTLCFGKHSFDQALRIIGELEFGKVDVALHEQGPHLRPSEVAADLSRAAQFLRTGLGLSPAAFSVEIDTPDPQLFQRQFRAVCRLANITTVPVISVPASSAGSSMDAEVRRLTTLVHLAEAEGILLTVETTIGTLTESPARAVELCERVPGLGLALDPSHYSIGPNHNKGYDQVYPFVRHTRLRDTGRNADQFQVRIGQGEMEYSRIISQLTRFRYERSLTVDIRDIPDAPFAMEPEVRKLKYLLESLV